MYPFASPMMMGQAAGGGPLRPQDVFQILTKPANQMQAAINALSFTPDLLVDKDRVATGDWSWRDRTRGFDRTLASNTLAGQTVWPAYSGSNSRVVYAFGQADKFLKIGLFNHVAGAADSFDLSTLGVVGWVHIKRIDASGDWYVWTRSLTAGRNLRLNSSGPQSTSNAYIGVSGTTMTFAAGAPAGAYIFEAWAHNPDATNSFVQCGSFGSGSSGSATVPIGYRPQAVIIKRIDDVSSWFVFDAVRGWGAGPDAYLFIDSSNGEGNLDVEGPTDAGFTITGLDANATFTFLAIRAPIT